MEDTNNFDDTNMRGDKKFAVTIVHLLFFIATMAVASYFGRFGGPFDDWVRAGNLQDTQIIILMLLAWSLLATGIIVRKFPLQFVFLTGWAGLSSLMGIFQDLYPFLNLAAALCVLIGIVFRNRIRLRRYDLFQ